MTTVELIASAEARARLAVERGRDDLARELAHAEEWKPSHRPDGKPCVVPQRAMLAGMLQHLDAALRGAS